MLDAFLLFGRENKIRVFLVTTDSDTSADAVNSQERESLNFNLNAEGVNETAT